jgi:hypothetical protein
MPQKQRFRAATGPRLNKSMSRAKSPVAASTHKKVIVLLLDRSSMRGYLNPGSLGPEENIDLLTADGEHRSIDLQDVKSIHFVREFLDAPAPERKTFLSRPKLDGLWVRLRFRDEDVMEGIVANDLLDLLDKGVQLTPPDLHGNTLRIFIPRSALAEVKVLGVVGVARRAPADSRVATFQSKLFTE